MNVKREYSEKRKGVLTLSSLNIVESPCKVWYKHPCLVLKLSYLIFMLNQPLLAFWLWRSKLGQSIQNMRKPQAASLPPTLKPFVSHNAASKVKGDRPCSNTNIVNDSEVIIANANTDPIDRRCLYILRPVV